MTLSRPLKAGRGGIHPPCGWCSFASDSCAGLMTTPLTTWLSVVRRPWGVLLPAESVKPSGPAGARWHGWRAVFAELEHNLITAAPEHPAGLRAARRPKLQA